MRTLFGVVAALLLSVAGMPAHAIPPGLPYAGQLAGPDGQPYTGSADIEVSLYGQEAGGSAIWGPTVFLGVDVVDGAFSIVLDGASEPISDALEGVDEVWLGFSVKPQGEATWLVLDGRQQLLSVAFAHQAGNADKLGGVPAAEYLTAVEAEADYVKPSDLAPVATTGDYADLTNKPDLSGYALTADLAGVCFSGSYADLVDEPDVSMFVTQDALATVATTGQYADLEGKPDLSVYALVASLAQVATTGQFDDLQGKPDLSVYALEADLAVVATTGQYDDLLGAPAAESLVLLDGSRAMTGNLDLAGNELQNAAVHPSDTAPTDPKVGQIWFDTVDETLKVFTSVGWAPAGSGAFSADGLAGLTNGTLGNIFQETVGAESLPASVPDGDPSGLVATIEISDSGLFRWVTVSVAIAHPNTSQLQVVLTAPGGQTFTLHDGGAGVDLAGSWPPDSLVDGDLGSLEGTAPSGIWTLTVTDSSAGDAGSLDLFEIDYEIARDGVIAVTGNQTVTGTVTADSLVVGGTDVVAKLTELEGEIWCLKNCDPLRIGDCKDRACDGDTHTCTPSGNLADGTLCENATGRCVAGACAAELTDWFCGGVRCPTLAAYTASCNTTDYCEYRRTSPTEAWQYYDVWIYVPPGQFDMGSPQGEGGAQPYEQPVHTVVFDEGYFIGKYEVPTVVFEACQDAGACGALSVSGWDATGWGLNRSSNDHATHPQNGVRWTDAQDVCAWLGGRQPSEAEWQRAAVGANHRKYPWGDTPEPSCSNGFVNFNESDTGASGSGCGTGGTVPVDSGGDISAVGAFHMAGNVNESLADCWHKDYTGAPADGTTWDSDCDNTNYVANGGSFISSSETVRSSARGSGAPSDPGVSYFGARCIRGCGNLGPCPHGFHCTPLQFCENSTTGEVWVPAGTFWMGCNSAVDSNCNSDEYAQHEVILSSYLIDKTEVTASAYAACVAASVCTPGGTGTYATYGVPEKDAHPVNFVNWDQATAYCAWPAKPAGVQRLCTGAEWERAARGGCETVEGDCKTGMRTYPWGNGAPTSALANFNSVVGQTAPVGSRSPAGDSPYGAQDMAGNIGEWVYDWSSDSYPATAASDPQGPQSGIRRQLKGGYFLDAAATIRSSWRGTHPPGTADGPTGFRCCRSQTQ